ncbi:hypothetical protein ACFQ88_39205 [Paenibacillus sp. NPDC056579]|uniref:hypothetical protein n=1 Tax=Paenibacillus sp. NPDC056579 TaxID=3345871 RepID=UPI0036945D6F
MLPLSKNKRIVFLSVGILLLLILSVLFLRDPTEPTLPKAAEEQVTIPEQKVEELPEQTPSSDDGSQKKIQELMDELAEVGLEALPGAWENVREAGLWFFGFDTPYAIVLIILAILLVAIIIPRGKSTNK